MELRRRTDLVGDPFGTGRPFDRATGIRRSHLERRTVVRGRADHLCRQQIESPLSLQACCLSGELHRVENVECARGRAQDSGKRRFGIRE